MYPSLGTFHVAVHLYDICRYTSRLIIKIEHYKPSWYLYKYYTIRKKNQTKFPIQQYFIHMTSHHLIKNVYLSHKNTKTEMVEFKFSTFCCISTPRFLHNILIFKAIYLYIVVDITCVRTNNSIYIIDILTKGEAIVSYSYVWF